MTEDEYDEWCRKLPRCKGQKVIWPTRALAEQALPVMIASAQAEGLPLVDPGVYRCDGQYGCKLFHLTRDLDRENHPSRNQRQRHNQPDTAREKQRRQRQNRRRRDQRGS